jgi:hypothetical protein
VVLAMPVFTGIAVSVTGLSRWGSSCYGRCHAELSRGESESLPGPGIYSVCSVSRFLTKAIFLLAYL